jgi:hypothetical protein
MDLSKGLDFMNENLKDLVAHYNVKNYGKPRSIQETTARYHQKCEQYKNLRKLDNPNHEQVSMLYAEAKALGWVIGKDEKAIIQDLNF